MTTNRTISKPSMHRRQRKRLDQKHVAELISDYVKNEKSVTVAAVKCGVSAATATYYAKKSGVELRGRGRRKMSEPTARQKEILSLIGLASYGQIGKGFNLTRQRVCALAGRWPEWVGRNVEVVSKPGIHQSNRQWIIDPDLDAIKSE